MQFQMGMFSAHRKRTDGQPERYVLRWNIGLAPSHIKSSSNPSTPVKNGDRIKYTATTETPPSSSKLAIRPPTPVPACPSPPLTPQRTKNNPFTPSSTTKTVRPSASDHSLPDRDTRLRPSKRYTPESMINPFSPTPRLPGAWTEVHDHAMCVLDTCNYSLDAIVKKLRTAFPELQDSPLTQTMVDKRLRVLDQNPEINYFRTGLDHVTREANQKIKQPNIVSTDGGPSGYDTRIPPDPRVSTLTAPTSTVDSSDMTIPSLPSIPDHVHRARQQSAFSLKTDDSNTSQGGAHTEPFGTSFLSHRASTLEREML